MASPLRSLIATGTKLWLDSIDPDLVIRNRALGATGATSNPIIIADLVKTGRFDGELAKLMERNLSDDEIAWELTDGMVRQAQAVFEPVWKETQGNDGYVSFELDPLLEDPENGLTVEERTKQYIELGKRWSAGHTNRMIKIPATPAGLAAVGPLAAAGVTLNVTLIFSSRQYVEARNNIWGGAQQRSSLDGFKSVYSIFVSRVDVYTEAQVPELSKPSQGLVGIINAKKIWQLNEKFWANQSVKLQQEIVFASTGTKKPTDDAWKYVQAFAGSGIETNPPATNDLVEKSGMQFERYIDWFPNWQIVLDVEKAMDWDKMEAFLMEEGIKKFADPQKALLKLIAAKRKELKK